MISFPNAKINLGLHILGKREDGYRDIESVFLPVPFCDALEVLPAKTFSLHVHGLHSVVPVEQNLVRKAWILARDRFDIPPVNIHLLKSIPPGSGLGGGSADGSFTLKALNSLFSLGLQDDELERLALEMGSDCPFFIRNKAAYVSGRGEQIRIVFNKLSGLYAIIILTGITLLTGEIFKAVIPSQTAREDLMQVYQGPLELWKSRLTNELEVPVFRRYPELRRLKEALYRQGAIYASMTGSGSALYGIFREKAAPGTSEIKHVHHWVKL